jgi:tetratricopeptide (TPR) repeat protein
LIDENMKRSIYIFKICLVLYLLTFSEISQDLIEQGKILFQSERYDEAKIIFGQILDLNSENPEANYFMGRIYFAAGDYHKAKEYLEKAIRYDEENMAYHLWLAAVYQEKARRANFLSAAKWAGKWHKELERAFETDPKNIEARRRLIFYYLNAPRICGGDKEKRC